MGNPETYGLGGAILLQINGDSTNVPQISNSLFLGNYSDIEGGAIHITSYGAKIYNCIFIENKSGVRGGAIFSITGEDFETKITNCTFIDNKSEYGSTVSSWSNNNLIYNCAFRNEITDNSHIFSSNNATITAENCYFSAPYCDSLFIEEAGSGTFNCGPNNLFDIDPKFLDEANGDYRLDYCSPLIDAGNRPIVEELNIENDITGVDRVINSAPDIGAYENDDVLVNLFTQGLSVLGNWTVWPRWPPLADSRPGLWNGQRGRMIFQ